MNVFLSIILSYINFNDIITIIIIDIIIIKDFSFFFTVSL